MPGAAVSLEAFLCVIQLGENIYNLHLVGSHFDATHRTLYNSSQMTGWEYVHFSPISRYLHAFLRKSLQMEGIMFVVVVSGVCCGCLHDINDEFADESTEFVELKSVVVAVCM